MPPQDFDALIIGGGPAGSTAGAYLALAGLRVLIVEKAKFPRFHIGESVMPMSNGILQETGVWEKVEAAGFQRKHGAEFHVGSRSVLPKHVEFRKGLVPGLDYTYQVDRARFDQILLDHARELGCEVREETKVTALRALGRDGYEAVCEPGQAVRAGFVLDASGRDTHFAKPVQRAAADPALDKRVAIYAHFEGVRRSSGRAEGNIVIVRNDTGWIWLIPLDGGRCSIGVITTAARMRSERLSPEALFRRIVAECPKVAQAMEDSTAISPFHATADYNYRAKQFCKSRLLLIGDAACFLDPMFSTGVFLALLSAKLAAAEVVQAHHHRRGRGLSWLQQRRYARRLGSNLATLEKLVKTFYDDAGFAVFMERNAPLRMAPAINSMVAGHADPPWPVRWRYWLFLLVCRVQRFRPLVPPVDFRLSKSPAGTAVPVPLDPACRGGCVEGVPSPTASAASARPAGAR